MSNIVLIIGSRGLVGSRIVQELHKSKKYFIISINRNHDFSKFVDKSYAFDISDFKSLEIVLQSHKPNYVIYSAGLTNVDLCEKNVELSKAVNVYPIQHLIGMNQYYDRIIYLSTDSVFDGIKGHYYEYDYPRPINVYAKHKFLAEKLVSENINKFIIYRFNVVGLNLSHNKSLINWVFNSIAYHKKITAFGDVFFNPIHPQQLSQIIINDLEDTKIGLFHIPLNRFFSKYEFILEICKLFGYDTNLISNDSIDSIGFKAKRPKNTVLSSSQNNYSDFDEMFELIKIDFKGWYESEFN